MSPEQIVSAGDRYNLAKEWLVFWASHKVAQEVAPDPLATIEEYMVSDLGADDMTAIIDTRLAVHNVEPKFRHGMTIADIMHRNWRLRNIEQLSPEEKEAFMNERINWTKAHALIHVNDLPRRDILPVSAPKKAFTVQRLVGRLRHLVYS